MVRWCVTQRGDQIWAWSTFFVELWWEEKRKGGESTMPIRPKVVYTGRRQVEVGNNLHHATDIFQHAYVAWRIKWRDKGAWRDKVAWCDRVAWLIKVAWKQSGLTVRNGVYFFALQLRLFLYCPWSRQKTNYIEINLKWSDLDTRPQCCRGS